MGKTRDLLKKNGLIKGILHARMGMIKNRNGKDLTETEEIKKKCQEYTEELYKKDLNDTERPRWYAHSPGARHPGMQSHVSLRKHQY